MHDLNALIWRPLFSYLDCDVPISWECSIPQRPWLYRSQAVGGRDESTAGVQESFVLRHDRIYILRLRLTENEWVEDFEPMMRTLWQQAQDFTVQLDALDVTTEVTVALVGPWMDEGVEGREHDCPGVLEIDIKVRTSDGSVFPAFPYFPDLDEVVS